MMKFIEFPEECAVSAVVDCGVSFLSNSRPEVAENLETGVFPASHGAISLF